MADVEEKTKNIHITSKKVTESYEKGVEALERQNKTLEAVKQGVEYVFGYVSKGFDKWREIDEKVYTVGRQIGLSTKELRNYQINVMNNYDNLASKLGMTFEELFKFQETYTKNTGRAIGLTNEQVLSLGTMSKLVGDVATNDMVKNMDDFGASTQTATSYLALNMARAKSQGLDAQKASEAFSKNVKLAASHNFREGVNGISKMTLLSQKLKFNMDSIANAADKFETIEGAIGTSANLQVLGGSFAAQFGNPLEAMNMAMLDMEGFTNKIVDTFSNKAIFNRETGQVEMSAIDKRFLKEAAKQLGISYDEAWNMASQQAKISDIERQIGLNTTSFTDKEKDFITSKAQYDAETKQHYVTVYQDGEAKQVNVKDLTSTQLEIMRDQKDVEHAMYSDVHGIHEKLSKYVGEDLSKNKSFNESIKGMDESIKINFADIHDEYMSPIVKPTATWLSDSNWWIAALGLGAVGTSIGYFFKDALSNIFKDIGNFIKGGINNRNQSQNTSQSGRQQPQQPQGGRQQPQQPQGGQRRTPKAKSKLFKGGIGRSLNRIGLKTLGKNGLKTLGKRIPYIGTAIAAVGGIMDASNAISSYNQKKMEIENSNLTEKEKAIAKTEVKREKNKSVGGAVGSTGGALGGAALGAAIGSFILPGVGTVIGGALGGWLGEKAGKSVGEAVGSAVTSEEKIEKQKLKEQSVNEIKDEQTILSQIKTYNQLIYELLLNRYSMVSESVINHNSSFNQNIVDNASKQLGVNNNYAYQNFDYKKLSNGYIDNNIDIKGNPIRTYNNKEYDLRDPKHGKIDISFDDETSIKNESSLKQQYNNSLRNNSLYNDVIYGNNSVVSRPNTYYNTKSFIDNISVKNNNNDIISKPTAGEYQYIRETNNYQQQSFNNGLINNKLDLNVSGTIKLTSDRGNSVDIDLNKLLNNPSFINQLTTMISNEMNKRSNFGVGKDYNSVSHIMGGASSRSVLNATTNGAK